MSIKAGILSDDVAQQIELLKVYPEIAEKHYRPVMVKDVQVLKDLLLMGTPVRTGRAQKKLGSKVTGKGTSIMGEVGWYGAAGKAAWYIRLVDAGTKPHVEEGYGSEGRGRIGIMKFAAGGKTLFRKSVQHPGVSARGFTQAAWDQAGPMVAADFAIANEAVVNELAVP